MENQKVVTKNVAVEEKKESGRKPLPIMHTKDVSKLADCMMRNGVR